MKTKTNRQRIYRVLAAIENGPRLQLFLGTPENVVQLMRQMMQEGVVDFLFRKESTTELVRRRGTLRDIEERYQFKSDAERFHDPTILTYWDVERGGWRSCLARNLIGYFE